MAKSPGQNDDREYDHRPGHYRKFEQDMLNARLADIKFAYQQYKAKKVADQTKKWPFFLNISIVETICFLFVNDIKQFKLVHDAEGGTDNIKRAAYISRWIAKMRPIQFDRRFPEKMTSESHHPGLAFLNEEFAIFMFFLYLRNFDKDRTFESPFTQSLAMHLKYIFSQREPQREMLAALAYATEHALKAIG